ncbi:unnamed protein product [Pedinophyceae sp. YPF-701]|nr:unnamed protein product [Pedinophyceae sp. YPF-701]
MAEKDSAVAQLDDAASFPLFSELPESVQAYVASFVEDVKDLKSLACTSRAMHRVTAHYRERWLCCKACARRLFAERAVIEEYPGSSKLGFQIPRVGDGPSVRVDDARHFATDETAPADRNLIYYFFAFHGMRWAIEPWFKPLVRRLRCPNCRLYLGMAIDEIPDPPEYSPTGNALYSSSSDDSDGVGRPKTWKCLEGIVLVDRDLLERRRWDGRPCTAASNAPLPRVPLLCRGPQPRRPAPAGAPAADTTPAQDASQADGGAHGATPPARAAGGAAAAAAQEEAPRCGSVLFHRHQVLSTGHVWDAGSGAEPAWYVNAPLAGAVRVGPRHGTELAQGRMSVADVECARCGRCIGWRFGRDLEAYDNVRFEGRWGFVASALAEADGGRATGGVGSETMGGGVSSRSGGSSPRSSGRMDGGGSGG